MHIPKNPRNFRAWQRTFERKLPERPDLQESFSWLIKAGCNLDDLERALFWVVVNFHISAGTTPGEIRDFFVLVDGILPKLQELRPNLDALLNWHSQNRPVPGFDLYLDLLDFLFPHLHIPQQRNRILPIPELLNHLDILLTAIQAAYKMDARQIAARAATVPEVLLIEYVRYSTRSTSQGIEETTLQRKRLTNTPVRQAGSVLKCPDDFKNRVVSAQATYTSGGSADGG